LPASLLVTDTDSDTAVQPQGWVPTLNRRRRSTDTTLYRVVQFGSALNEHTLCHVVVIDGVVEPDLEQSVGFIAAEAIDADVVRVVQTQIAAASCEYSCAVGGSIPRLAKRWKRGTTASGSLDASARIKADDRKGLQPLLRYCALPPLAADRMQELDAQSLIYRLPKPGPNGRTQISSHRSNCSAALPR